MMKKTYTTIGAAAAAIGLVFSAAADTATGDIIIYGSSPAAIAAAVQARRMGKSAIVVSPETRIGGLTTGGLGQTDIGNKAAFGGIALEFYKDVARWYSDKSHWTRQTPEQYKPGGQTTGTMGADSMWTFEPSAALAILEGWEKRDALDIRRGEWLDRENGVEVKDGRIVSVKTLSGNVYRGKVFVDATYEGDLMAAAGVKYHVGREANSVYGETINGIERREAKFHQLVKHVSPYVVEGKPESGLLPGIEPFNPDEKDGDGDSRVQAYNFRMCLTDDPENRIPFKKPANYDEREYELLFRNFAKGAIATKPPWINSKMPNRKTDTNNRYGFSTDFIGRNYEWPEASYERRAEIFKAHLDYQRGLMWTLACHPRVPEPIRAEVSRWGMCKDEFLDGPGGGWQTQLYVREARRMIGEYVMTEHECRGDRIVPHPVAMGAYTMDSHNVRRVVTKRGNTQNEGDVEDSRRYSAWGPDAAKRKGGGRMKPYGIDYGSICPKRAECENLLVPVCLSASHMAFGSIRMEPVFFALGQAAGTAASLAVDGGTGGRAASVQDVPYAELSKRLLADGQVVSLDAGKPQTGRQSSKVRKLRIMSYNILHGKGADKKVDIRRTAEAIARENPDFAGLQEVDCGCARSGRIDEPAELARLTGLHPTFAAAFPHQGGEYGRAVLSREKPMSVERVQLDGKNPGVLLLCEFPDFWFATMHLDLIETNRLRQVEIVRSAVSQRARTKPVILTGDWNATPQSETLARLREFMTVVSCENARTFHAFKAEKPKGEYCIDYIAVDSRHAGNVRAADAHVTEDLVTSDHNPVLVTLELENAAGGVEFRDPADFNPVWESANPGTCRERTIPTGALLGNGSLGAVNGGDGNHKEFVLTRGDLWSCGDLTCGNGDNNVRPISFADFSIGPGMRSVKSTDILDLPAATLRTAGGFGKGSVKMEAYVASTEDLFVVTGVSGADDEWAVHLTAHNERKSFPIEVNSSKDALYVRRSTVNLLPQGDPRGWTTNATAALSVIGAELGNFSTANGCRATAWAKIRANEPFAFVVSSDPARRFTWEELAKIRAAHEAWWKEWWSRSRVATGDVELDRFYCGQVYLMGAGIRSGKFPPGLYGIWVTTDNPKWHNDFHMNYNYVAPFYGCFAANRCEVADSMPDPLIDYLPQAMRNAKEILPNLDKCRDRRYKNTRAYIDSRPDVADGIDDAAFYPVALGPWGSSAEGADIHWSQVSDGAFQCAVMCTHWEYTLDRGYLKKVWPVLDKTANFFLKWSEKETLASGGYRYNVWDSHWEGSGLAKNSAPALGCVKHLFETLVDVAPVLREIGIDVADAKLAAWKDMHEHLAELPVGVYQIDGKPVKMLSGVENADGSANPSGGNALNLESVIPGEQFAFDVTPEFRALAIGAVDGNIAKSPKRVWTCPNQTPKLFATAIRAGYPAQTVIDAFKKHQLSIMQKNFHIHEGVHGVEKTGAMEFVQSMFLQCDHGYVKVFPNWTGADAKFENLRAKGCFLVSAEMKDGKVVRVEIKSEKGGVFRLVDPWKGCAALRPGWAHGRTRNSGEATIERDFAPGEKAVLGDMDVPPPSCGGYVVAVDNATMGAKGWKSVVNALDKKHGAKVVEFASGKSGMDSLVAELAKVRPMYVCFVLRPESAGRDFVKAAHEAMRRIDDDPYGDAIWGIITGYDADDALKTVNAPLERTIRSIASSMGGPHTLDPYDSGFASDERTADNFWIKRPGGANMHIATGGNVAMALADAFNSIPVDYLVTSGHASERDWQIVYNQDKGTLVHTKDAGLQFVEPGGGVRHDLKGASVRAYLGAGNCLIGHVDSRACMATAWMHAAGVEQFAGYTVPSWYGFMGWGVCGLFGEGRHSLPESCYLENQRLLWARNRRHPKSEDKGLDYDRDAFAFYGDPKQRIVFESDRTPYMVAVEGDNVTVAFSRDCDFPALDDVRGARPVMAVLDAPPPGDALVDADGRRVSDSVVTERFVFIPMSGRHAAGETHNFKICKS